MEEWFTLESSLNGIRKKLDEKTARDGMVHGRNLSQTALKRHNGGPLILDGTYAVMTSTIVEFV
jgi:hypothetical protein